MRDEILICTDLDRTLLPNGLAPESPGARRVFASLAARPEVQLAYVTGRHRELVIDAIEEFTLPVPDYVIGDVGTSIYHVDHGQWTLSKDWHNYIAESWHGLDHDALAYLFSDIGDLQQQEAEKQNTYKLSYYAPADSDVPELLIAMQQRLDSRQINASLIWSVDETGNIGLLDVLPENATKLHAVEFLMHAIGIERQRTVYAGDSGNDLPVLTSPIQSVLVANASDDVRTEAVKMAADNNTSDSLYLARGGFMHMNGNYSAGILEGVAHYLPHTAAWLQQEDKS